MPIFDYENLPRALYLGLVAPTIRGKDIVTWGLATHFTDERNLDKIRSDLTFYLDQSSSKHDIEAIIDKNCAIKFNPQMIK